MAAGASSRFGANKLSALINGKPMIEYAFDAVPAEKLGMVLTVTGYDEVETLAASYGFRCIRNHHPELGLSHTIRLGTEALSKQCSAILPVKEGDIKIEWSCNDGKFNYDIKLPKGWKLIEE